MGLTRFELVTPRLSSVCSNQLSYRPRYSRREAQRLAFAKNRCRFSQNWIVRATQQFNWLGLSASPSLSARSIFEMPASALARFGEGFSRKEVIQPQVLLQLPCYDFTPITDHTLGASLPCGLVWRLLVQPAFVM